MRPRRDAAGDAAGRGPAVEVWPGAELGGDQLRLIAVRDISERKEAAERIAI